jgi:hypothetical protein
MVVVRALADVLASTFTAMVAVPLPLAGETLAQLAPAAVVQAHPAIVVTDTLDAPELDPIDSAVGDIEYVQVTAGAACSTVAHWPATVKLSDRAEDEVLAEIVTVTVPLPSPLAGETENHDEELAATHVQVGPVVIAIVNVPPPVAALIVAGAIA